MPFRHLLLIDDDEDDQEIFLTAAKEASDASTCIALLDATEGLKKLEEKEIAPDVIFLDLNMPVMNGQQFLAAIKQKPDLNRIPVIIFSTTSNPQTIHRLRELGAYDFITKPDTYDQLVHLLKPLLI